MLSENSPAVKIKSFLRDHFLAIVISLCIGLICVAPHIVFKISLGNEYKGIYLTQTSDELAYLARIQEIVDGYWTTGSVPFFEYKNNPPLMPPTALETLIAGINKFFKISVTNIVIAGKFFLPAIFFLLIYFLVNHLTEKKESIGNKINAIAASLLIVLGYDLIDYKSLFSFFYGRGSPEYFLLWTRPSNPILGGLLIYSFLLVVWHLYANREGKNRFGLVFFSGLILALAITSYFFSWAVILSIVGLLAIVGLFKKNFRFFKNLFFMVLTGLILASPYFYNIYLGSKNIFYQESAFRTGLFLTHEPILNIFLIFSFIIFLILSFFFKKIVKENIFKEDWWLFSLILILAGFISFNQQVITGRTIWPFHFVQYTVPLSITALFVVFYNLKNKIEKLKGLWGLLIILIIVSSLSFGIYTQISVYKKNYEKYKEMQKYADVFGWINKNIKKDCVILSEDRAFMNQAIPAFTHCNVYFSDFWSFLLPFDRIYYNFLVYLRLEGVSSDEIENYIKKNTDDILVYLYGTHTMIDYNVADYEDVLKKIATDYKEFLTKDFEAELKKYRIDYLVSEKKINKNFNNLNLVYGANNIFLYQFK